jgi:hypothetical protein
MQQQGKDEDAQPAPLHLTAHPTLPLPLLSGAQSFRGMFVSAQLCDAQGTALFPFVHLPSRVRRPFAGAPVHSLSLTNGEKLRVVGCGLTGKLVRLLSLGTGCYFEPNRNRNDCHKLMHFNAGRVADKLMHSVAAAVGNKVGKEAEELCASGQCAAAAVALTLAVDLGHLSSRALKAWMLIDGRECVDEDCDEAFELAKEGARLGCHHCQGVLACCYKDGLRCRKDEAQSLELARKSSERNSRYGQFTLGMLYYYGEGGLVEDITQAIAFYQLAAAQGLDSAQFFLGACYDEGHGVAQSDDEAMRLYLLAAAQGHGEAMWRLSCIFRAKARYWQRHAVAANCFDALCFHFKE